MGIRFFLAAFFAILISSTTVLAQLGPKDGADLSPTESKPHQSRAAGAGFFPRRCRRQDHRVIGVPRQEDRRLGFLSRLLVTLLHGTAREAEKFIVETREGKSANPRGQRRQPRGIEKIRRNAQQTLRRRLRFSAARRQRSQGDQPLRHTSIRTAAAGRIRRLSSSTRRASCVGNLSKSITKSGRRTKRFAASWRRSSRA